MSIAYILILLLMLSPARMLAAENWRAQWISTEKCQSLPNTWLAFRKEVTLESVPHSLTACIAADTKYWLWVNGRMVVFEGGLKRGPQPRATYYDRVEIAPYLVEGDNVIALLVWHFGKNGFSHAGSGTAGLFFQAIGEGVEICSDRTWQCALYDAYQTAEGTQPNYRLPESNLRFDARKELTGWQERDYHGGGFRELMGWQRADGTLYAPVPTGNYFKELPLQMLAITGWYGFYTQYFFSADSTFVPDIYDGLHRYLHEVWQVDDEGFPLRRAGEWDWGDWGKDIDMGLLTTCWYYLALKAEQAFALQMGRQADAEQDAAMREAMAKAFDRRYWTGTAFRSPDYTGQDDDRAQAMAILAGLATKDKYAALTDVLEREEHASPYMEKYVLEALFTMGETDRALQRLHRRYAHMINDYPQCSTLFELWTSKGGSTNHAWTGGPLTLLSQWVAGIMPTSPGFRTFEINPHMGSLTQVNATVDTPYGLIRVQLERVGEDIKMTVDAPTGTNFESEE